MPTNVATARTDWLAALVWRHLKRHRDARSYSPLSAMKRAGEVIARTKRADRAPESPTGALLCVTDVAD
jgi:hypothetical protein